MWNTEVSGKAKQTNKQNQFDQSDQGKHCRVEEGERPSLMRPNNDIIWGSSPKNCKKNITSTNYIRKYLIRMKKIKTIINFKNVKYHKYFPT